MANKKPTGVSSNKSNTDDTDNTDNTDNTDDTVVLPVSPVSPVLCVTEALLDSIFEGNILDRIRRFLCTKNKLFTFADIAKAIGKKESNVRQAVNRRKDLFLRQSVDGRKVVIQMIQSEMDEIRKKIEEIRQFDAQKKEKKKEHELKELKKRKHILEVEEYLRKTKPKREGLFLLIDYQDVLLYSSSLADLLLEEPKKFIEQVEYHFSDKLSVKIVNFPEINQTNIEDLRQEHLNGLLCIEGRVTSIGEVRPVITSLTYSCPSCGALVSQKQNYRLNKIQEVFRCSCGRRGGFIEESREQINSCFIQLEDLQDKTDNPHSRRLKAVLFKSLCESGIIKRFTPGNEVRVMGVLKEVPIMKGNNLSPFLDWVFEVNDVELIEKNINVKEFEEKTIEEIKKLAYRIDKEGHEILHSSFSPEVHGYEEIKDALMLQLSNRRNECKEKSTRNKSNILLIGDPGIAKTVLCKYAVKISSGAREAVGGGSSAVGITASVVKEEDSMGGYRVEPGAMILAKDLLFLDELNNLNEEDKPKLQEGMSEQRVSINKANLHVKMKVTCGILSVANPLYGHFKNDAKETLAEQFNIPSPILNRFDTVFMMRDQVNEKNDKKIAEIMMRRHNGNLDLEYSAEFLKEYFAYVRYFPEPEIKKEISELMKEIYSAARTSHGNLRINPRFFESLTRMSSASAKMRLSPTVEAKDIKMVLKILSKSQYELNELFLENLKIGKIK